MTLKKDTIDLKSYRPFLEQIKADIESTQLKAATAVTKNLISLYWRIGTMISQKVQHEGWGAKTIERLFFRQPSYN